MLPFRNDHEAALARIDALEHDNARLAAENATLRAPAVAKKEERRRPFVALAIMGAVVVAGGLTATLAFAASASSDVAKPVETGPGPTSYVTASDVNDCVRHVGTAPAIQRWDHVAFSDVEAIGRTALPCELSNVSLYSYSSDQRTWTHSREALHQLALAEDELRVTLRAIRDSREGVDPGVPSNTISLALADSYEAALAKRDLWVKNWSNAQLMVE